MLRTVFAITLFLCFTGKLSAQEVQPCDSVRAKQRINEIYKMLSTGKTFDQLIKTYTEDPGTNTSNGGAYEGKVGIFEAHYRTIFKKLKPGGISKPFRNEFGYSIVQLVYLKNGTVKFKHLLISCPK